MSDRNKVPSLGGLAWPPGRRPTPIPLRGLAAGLSAATLFVGVYVLPGLVPPTGWLTTPAFSVGLNWVYGLVFAANMLAGVLLLPLVSYRRRDALVLLVPIVNLVMAGRLGYRLASLPNRDWAPRPDEAAPTS